MKNLNTKSANVSTKNVNDTKGTINLVNGNKESKALLDAKKDSIKKGIDFNSLDFKNLLNATTKVNVEKAKNVNEKHFIYKFERESLSSQKAQSMRTKIRKQISNKIDNVIFYFNAKNEVELKKSIVEFKEFYLKTYILNDYSINSIYANHVEQIKKDKLKMTFDIILLVK